MNEENPRRNSNGWTNYETWAVRLWLDNEEPSHRYWTEQARHWHGRKGAAYRLAEQLKEELSDASPVNEPTVYGDLMNAALEEVNWLEIAESYLDEIEPDDGRESPDTDALAARRLTADEIEKLSEEEFGALPREERESYFHSLDRENSPSAGEFYGYDSELDRPVDPDDDVIYCYTRRQAIADGVLVDVTDTARFADFRFPVAFTRAVWADYVAVPTGVEGQDEEGRLWDILWMCRVSLGRVQDREMIFRLHVRNDNREGEPPLVTLKAVCGPDDDGSPCITIMLPDED